MNDPFKESADSSNFNNFPGVTLFPKDVNKMIQFGGDYSDVISQCNIHNNHQHLLGSANSKAAALSTNSSNLSTNISLSTSFE
jgi:hypothetical protein